MIFTAASLFLIIPLMKANKINFKGAGWSLFTIPSGEWYNGNQKLEWTEADAKKYTHKEEAFQRKGDPAHYIILGKEINQQRDNSSEYDFTDRAKKLSNDPNDNYYFTITDDHQCNIYIKRCDRNKTNDTLVSQEYLEKIPYGESNHEYKSSSAPVNKKRLVFEVLGCITLLIAAPKLTECLMSRLIVQT